MKKNKGFIATSLIYSFFLVFIAILTALISSYIANKTILMRFNDDSMEDLNNDAHKVTIYSKNAGIKDGVVLANLVGDFSNLSSWNITNAEDFTAVDETILKKNSHTIGSFISQNVNLSKGHTYFFSLEYNDPRGSLSSYIKDDSYKIETLNANVSDTYTRYYSEFTYGSETDDLVQIVIGDSSQNIIGESYIAKVMLIDLSIPFGENLPNEEWLNKNLSWFTGNVGFRVIEGVKKDEEIKIEFMDNSSYAANVNCNAGDYNLEGNVLTLKNIENDVICNVDYN